MRIIFTTNEKFWSKVFKYLTGEPVSHVAMLFDVYEDKLTIDCSTDGGRLMTWDKFLSMNTLKYSINLPSDEAVDKELFHKSLFLVGKTYDMPAYIYGIWRGILWRFFNVPAPSKNKLSKPNLYCCTEIFLPISEILKREYQIDFGDMDLAIQSPYGLYLFFKDKIDVNNSIKKSEN
jgi:hypothetical protein